MVFKKKIKQHFYSTCTILLVTVGDEQNVLSIECSKTTLLNESKILAFIDNQYHGSYSEYINDKIYHCDSLSIFTFLCFEIFSNCFFFFYCKVSVTLNYHRIYIKIILLFFMLYNYISYLKISYKATHFTLFSSKKFFLLRLVFDKIKLSIPYFCE